MEKVFGKLRPHAPLFIRFGLAAIFAAQAYTAWFASDEFKEIFGNSFLSGVFPVSPEVFVRIIGVSDMLIALMLLAGRARRFIAAYACAWIAGVVVVAWPMEIPDMLEHVGFLGMALYLLVTA